MRKICEDFDRYIIHLVEISPKNGLFDLGFLISHPKALMDHFAFVFMDNSGSYQDAFRLGLPFHLDPYLDSIRGQSFQYRRFSFHGGLGGCDYSFEPAFIRKRNERERHRVRCVNEGYARLREHLPQELEDKRLSKVETLRAAIEYIKHLENLLDLSVSGMEAAFGDARNGDARNAAPRGSEWSSDGESKTGLSDSGDVY